MIASGFEAFVWVATIAAFLATIGAFARLARFRAGFPTLREWKGPDPLAWPTLSVIVPCRNEEKGVERAMRTLLAQDYKDLEIVAIDDRSEDRTGTILDALAKENERLTVVHVGTLPEGWLGKNHAMREGASRARGEWLLFTDGDVVFEPGALRRSVAFAIDRRLGHFVALPHFIAEGYLERAFVATFLVTFAGGLDLSRLHRAGSFAFVGVGAFGLVHKDAYAKIGGHAALAFEVADDVKLGLILRRSGIPQGALDSDGLVRVRWQDGLLATVRGLEKNGISGFEWRIPVAILAVTVGFVLNFVPYLALAIATPAWVAAAATIVLLLRVVMISVAARRAAAGSGLEGLAMPLTIPLLTLTIAWSTLLTLIQGGIRWRGTFYPLAKLQAGAVRTFAFSKSTGVGWEPPARPRR